MKKNLTIAGLLLVTVAYGAHIAKVRLSRPKPAAEPVQFQFTQEQQKILADARAIVRGTEKQEILRDVLAAETFIASTGQVQTISDAEKTRARAFLAKLSLYKKSVQARSAIGRLKKIAAGNKLSAQDSSRELRLEPLHVHRGSALMSTQGDSQPAVEMTEELKEKLSFIYSTKARLTGLNDTRSCTGIAPSNPDPQGDALTGSSLETERTTLVTTLAQKLGTPAEAYKYVREINNEARVGSGQTAEQVILSGEGTAFDKASLLIALLRAMNVPAEYKAGEIAVDEDVLKQYFGVEGTFDLFWVVATRNGIVDLTKLVYYKNGKRLWIQPHAWVNAFINGQWIYLDPSQIAADLRGSAPDKRWYSIDSIAELNHHFFDADAFNRIIKPGTFADQLVSLIGDKSRSQGGSGPQDIGYQGISKNLRAGGELTSGTIGEDALMPPCVEAQFNAIPPQYNLRSYMEITPASSNTIVIDIPLARARKEPLYIAHGNGLLGEGASGTGTLYVKLGTEILASQPNVPIGSSISVYHEAKGTLRYHSQVHLGRNTPGVTAGGLDVFTHEFSDVSEQVVLNEIYKIRDLIKINGSRELLYARLLRLAALTALHNSKDVMNDLDSIYSIHHVNTNYLSTGTVMGKVVDKQDRVLGVIPIGGTIDWTGGGVQYSRIGDHNTYNDYSNITNAVGATVAANSAWEHGIWESLFGIPSVSTVKILQTVAEFNRSRNLGMDIIRGEQLTQASASQIFARFGSGMQQQISAIQAHIADQPYLFVPVDTLTLDSGWQGVGWFEYPSKPGGSAGAFIATYTPGVIQGGSAVAPPVATPRPPSGQGLASSSRINTTVGCPVNVATGTMWHRFNDFYLKGRTQNSSLEFTRTYLSKPFASTGELGPNFVHSWEMRLLDANGNALAANNTGDIFFIDEGGGEYLYKKIEGQFTFQSPIGTFDTLTELSDHYELVRKDGTTLTFSKTGGVAPGKLLSIEDTHAQNVTLAYDSNSKLTQVSAALTGSISFARDGQGRITSITRDRDGLSYAFTYGNDGRLSQSSDFSNLTTTYEYVTDMSGTAAQGLLFKITDPIGRKIEFSYYQDGRAFEQTEPGSARRSFIYSPSIEKFTRILNNDDTVTEYKFDDSFRTIGASFPDGSSTSTAWTDNNLIASTTDELGFQTSYQYDSKGNTTGIKRPADTGFTQIQYNQTFSKPTRIVPLAGSPTDFTLDSNTGDVTQMKRVLNSDDIALQIGNDSFGTPITFNNGRVTYQNTTDANGLLTGIADLHNPETRTFDARGRVASRHFASGRTISISYDDYDRVTLVTDSNGPSVANQYDTMGRLLSKTVSDGTTNQVTSYAWDDRDRLVSTTDPMGRITQMQYDIMNVGCNVIDKVTTIIDPAGRKTQFEYDSRQRLSRIIDARGGVTRFEYDLKGNMIALTDAAGNRTKFEFDGNGRVVKKISPSVATVNGRVQTVSAVTNYTYSATDQLLKEEKILANQAQLTALVTESQFDALDRLISRIQKKVVNGVTVETQDQAVFTYETQLDATLLKTANNQNINQNLEYESQPPFALKNYSQASAQGGNPLNLIEGSLALTRNSTGEISEIKKDGTSILTQSHDAAGRLSLVTGTMSSHSVAAQFTRDGFGRTTNTVYSNGMLRSAAYDNLNRITQITGGGDFHEAISYDPQTGNITAITRENAQFTYSYDETDQLLASAYNGSVLSPVLNRSFGYDLTGNRTTDSITGVSQILRNVLTETDEALYYPESTGTGNLAQKTDKATGAADVFNYRVDGKLSSYAKYAPNSSSPSISAGYYFDAFGRRIAKRIQAGAETIAQSYFYLGDQNKILIGRAGDGTDTLFVDGQGIDEHLGYVNPQTAKVFVTDHLGTVVNDDAVGPNKLTGAFGEATSAAPVISQSSNSVEYGFAGYKFDVESLTYNVGPRQLDAMTGRWGQPDDIGFSGGDANYFKYVKNNPILYSDPSGRFLPALYVGLIAVAVFEVAFDATTFVTELANTGSLNRAVTAVSQRSPIFGDPFGSSVNAALPESVALPIQAFANPDTMNAIIQLKNQENAVNQALEKNGVGDTQQMTSGKSCPPR